MHQLDTTKNTENVDEKDGLSFGGPAMNRTEWTGIILGTAVLALGIYPILIVLGTLTERAADSADTCMIRNRTNRSFKLQFSRSRTKLIHSRSIVRLPAGPFRLRLRSGRHVRSACPSGARIEIITRGRRIAVARH